MPLKTTKFYFFVKENKELTVLATSRVSKLMIYANVIKMEDKSKSSWSFPSEKSYQYSSDLVKAHKANSIVIKDFSRERCEEKEGCVVTVMVQPKKEVVNGTFSITFTSSILPLLEGVQQTRYIEKDAIHYYRFDVAQNQTSIFMSLNHLDNGDPDLYVSFGEDARPAPKDYDWKGDFANDDSLVITPNSSAKIASSMKGTYVAGVYGYEAGIYTLNYITGDVQFMQLYKGFPIQASTKQGELSYFEYFSFDNTKPFKVVLTVTSGKAKLYGTLFEDLDQAVTQPLSSMEYSSPNQLNIDNKDCHADVCKYLFVVMPTNDAQFVITLTLQDEFIILPENTQQLDFVLKGNQQLYHIFTQKNFDLQLILYAGEIKVYGRPDSTITKSQNSFQQSLNPNEATLVKELSPNQKDSDDAGIYSVLVEGLQNSNYTIQYVSCDSVERIRFGYPTEISLEG